MNKLITLAFLFSYWIMPHGVLFGETPKAGGHNSDAAAGDKAVPAGAPLGIRGRPGNGTRPNSTPENGDHAHLSNDDIPCPPNDLPMTKEQKAVMVPLMDTREQRAKHSLWHIGSSGESDQSTDTINTAVGPGWLQPQNVCKPAPLASNQTGKAYNYTGESFLFKHHGMRNALNKALLAAGQKCVGGWTKIPDETSKDFPVPRRRLNPDDKKGAKDPKALAILQEWEKMFRNKFWLQAHTLGQLGWLMEKTIHNNMHMRWADESVGAKYNTNFPLDSRFFTQLGYPRGWNADEASNDYLGDPYGSHVNPIFWKLHGMIDDMILAWGRAQNPPITEFAENCESGGVKRQGCYTWKGTWVGGKYPAQQRSVALAAAAPGAQEDHPKAFASKSAARGEGAQSNHFKKHGLDDALIKELSEHIAGPKNMAMSAPRALPAAPVPPEDRAAYEEYQRNKAKWDQMANTMVSRFCPT